MQKFIRIGTVDDYFPVADVYPFIYQNGNGKQVLRIAVDPSVKSYEELFTLLNGTTLPIQELWEEEYYDALEPSVVKKKVVLKAEHTGYNKDYKCSFNGDEDHPNKFYIEITRKTAVELQAEVNQALMNSNNETLIQLFEAVN